MNTLFESVYNELINGTFNATDFVEEGFLNQLTMGLQIKPHQDLATSLKKHEYPGFLNLIKKTNNIDDLKYLRNDINTGISMINRITERITKCNKLGEVNETKSYYKGINKKYISKGITEKDCEKYVKWLKEVCKPEITKRIKELNDK